MFLAGPRRRGVRTEFLWRGSLAVALFCGVLLSTQRTAQAQANTKAGAAPANVNKDGEDRTLTTKDNQSIKITYFRSPVGKEAPVVVMLPGKGGNRQIWKSLARRLQEQGYAAITVDLRGHGDSGGGASGASQKSASNLSARDYQAMVALDLEAVKSFLFEENQQQALNMSKLAILAADTSVPVALAFAEADWKKEPFDDAPTLAAKTPRGQDVRALVLLSPELSVPGLNATRALTFLKGPAMNIAFLLIVGEKDTEDRGQARKMHTPLANVPKSEERIYFEKYDTNLRGTDLLGHNLPTELHILAFLKKHLKDLPGEWRDRRSRFSRTE